jgi:hypothetical protein
MEEEIAVGEQVCEFLPGFDMSKKRDSTGNLTIGFCLESQTERPVTGNQKAVVFGDVPPANVSSFRGATPSLSPEPDVQHRAGEQKSSHRQPSLTNGVATLQTCGWGRRPTSRTGRPKRFAACLECLMNPSNRVDASWGVPELVGIQQAHSLPHPQRLIPPGTRLGSDPNRTSTASREQPEASAGFLINRMLPPPTRSLPTQKKSSLTRAFML